MTRSQFRVVLSVSVLFLCGSLGCSTKEYGPQKPVMDRPASPWLVSPELLEAAKLEMVWTKKLPTKERESLEWLLVLGNRIYALTDQNYMASLSSENGDFVFSRPFAPAGFAVLGLELYKDELISVVGSKLVEINAETGREIRSKRLGFGAACPAARNSSYFYVAGSDRRLHTFRAEDKVEIIPRAADNESLITAIVADDSSVVFATEAGNVISVAPDERKRLWQFDAAAGIVGPIVREGESLFVASKDTYVYKLDVEMGTPPVWKYQAEAILDRAPRATREVVYQYVQTKGLTAIDKESGKFMWRVERGLDLLAEAGGKAYVLKDNGELVVMDNKTRKKLCSVNFAQVSRYAANTVDSKIYIADETGRISCLRPLE